MTYKRSQKRLRQFADLKVILSQSKQTDNALYQTVQEIIERLDQFGTETTSQIVSSGGGGGGVPGQDEVFIGPTDPGAAYELWYDTDEETSGLLAPHHVTHETGGADAVVNLAGEVITSGTIADARTSVNVLKHGGGYPGGTSTFLRADGTFSPASGGGGGDVVGPASSVDNSVALYSGVTGKLLKDDSKVIVDPTNGSIYTGSSGIYGFQGGGLPSIHTDANRALYLRTDAQWIYAITTNGMNLAGGVFIPGADNTQDISWSNLRWRSLYLGTSLSIGTNPAAGGAIRLAKDTLIAARNDANTADLALVQAYLDVAYFGVANNQGTTVRGLYLYFESANSPCGIYLYDTAFYPTVNAVLDLGTTANKWKDLYLSGSVKVGTNPATTGAIRLANNAVIYARNAANTADIAALSVTPADLTYLNGTSAVHFRVNGTGYWLINTTGALRATTDNTVDIGAVAAGRPRNIYVAGFVRAAGLDTTPLNADNITSGTVPDARLSINVLKHTGGYPGGTTNFLRADGTFAAPPGGGGGSGDVVGPASAVADNLASYNGTTGKLIKDSGILTSNVALRNAANVFTDNSPVQLSSARPKLMFQETDQPADQKRWNVVGETGTLLFEALNDAGTTVASPLILFRNGNVQVEGNLSAPYLAKTNQTNNFSESQFIAKVDPYLELKDMNQPADGRIFRVFNNNQKLWLIGRNDADSITSGYLAIDRLGNTVCTGGITERSRTVAQGEWIDVPFNAGNFGIDAGTWSLSAGLIYVNKFTLIGKTMIWSLTTGAGTLSQASNNLIFVIPGGYTSKVAFQSSPVAQIVNNGVEKTGRIFTAGAGGSTLNANCVPGASFTGSASIQFTVSFEIS